MNHEITGNMLLGAASVRGTQGVLRAFAPATGAELEPEFGAGSPADVDRACRLAGEAFDAFRAAPLETRAALLEAIATGIEQLGSALIERLHLETALPVGRLEGERARTCGQLRLFAQLVRDGRWNDATLDSALPERKPLPRADLRARKIPIGPVAVFGASNFPLAFSVAGGDTASALAAGCPVVVKAHEAHLGGSELVGRAIQQAVAEVGLPEGTFSLVIGKGNAVGEALVAHPAIKAVGFTGSRRGGLALSAIAAARAEPIPVHAEMSSINPVLLMPAALKARGAQLAQGFVESLVLGAGQFCTNPGLLLAIDGPELDAFVAAASAALAEKQSQIMLTAGIAATYRRQIDERAQQPDVARVADGVASGNACGALPVLFRATAATFTANHGLADEIFGPASIVVACRDEQELLGVLDGIEGQLTATLLLDPADYPVAKRVLPVLERKVGRILANGYPTGVEVCHAMVHGGPFPATSDSRTTSVGTMAIDRFLRPVCYQDLPAELLPEALRDENPLGIWRLRDGELVKR
ncbi:aldehyde dehydrogenase (NADP(+)) [Burkholderia plantarii]|uniref:Aldehyde dehydrogenase n=1 Tax=Burkholderia plantarii TaxID=41899 RepID=A0A0B6SE27_BURPL|nr:aldehyde dehydrogenase (NADP(+)) [Burkholderia plantarii]AJK50486.1 aldehyde dehydrogenase [Burkholderia plantarii]WLE63683.1 aldehyde dehydrogenase (NADP(+)) [Burkholderia plantarii]